MSNLRILTALATLLTPQEVRAFESSLLSRRQTTFKTFDLDSLIPPQATTEQIIDIWNGLISVALAGSDQSIKAIAKGRVLPNNPVSASENIVAKIRSALSGDIDASIPIPNSSERAIDPLSIIDAVLPAKEPIKPEDILKSADVVGANPVGSVITGLPTSDSQTVNLLQAANSLPAVNNTEVHELTSPTPGVKPIEVIFDKDAADATLAAVALGTEGRATKGLTSMRPLKDSPQAIKEVVKRITQEFPADPIHVEAILRKGQLSPAEFIVHAEKLLVTGRVFNVGKGSMMITPKYGATMASLAELPLGHRMQIVQPGDQFEGGILDNLGDKIAGLFINDISNAMADVIRAKGTNASKAELRRLADYNRQNADRAAKEESYIKTLTDPANAHDSEVVAKYAEKIIEDRKAANAREYSLSAKERLPAKIQYSAEDLDPLHLNPLLLSRIEGVKAAYEAQRLQTISDAAKSAETAEKAKSQASTGTQPQPVLTANQEAAGVASSAGNSASAIIPKIDEKATTSDRVLLSTSVLADPFTPWMNEGQIEAMTTSLSKQIEEATSTSDAIAAKQRLTNINIAKNKAILSLLRADPATLQILAKTPIDFSNPDTLITSMLSAMTNLKATGALTPYSQLTKFLTRTDTTGSFSKLFGDVAVAPRTGDMTMGTKGYGDVVPVVPSPSNLEIQIVSSSKLIVPTTTFQGDVEPDNPGILGKIVSYITDGTKIAWDSLTPNQRLALEAAGLGYVGYKLAMRPRGTSVVVNDDDDGNSHSSDRQARDFMHMKIGSQKGFNIVVPATAPRMWFEIGKKMRLDDDERMWDPEVIQDLANSQKAMMGDIYEGSIFSKIGSAIKKVATPILNTVAPIASMISPAIGGLMTAAANMMAPKEHQTVEMAPTSPQVNQSAEATAQAPPTSAVASIASKPSVELLPAEANKSKLAFTRILRNKRGKVLKVESVFDAPNENAIISGDVETESKSVVVTMYPGRADNRLYHSKFLAVLDHITPMTEKLMMKGSLSVSRPLSTQALIPSKKWILNSSAVIERPKLQPVVDESKTDDTSDATIPPHIYDAEVAAEAIKRVINSNNDAASAPEAMQGGFLDTAATWISNNADTIGNVANFVKSVVVPPSAANAPSSVGSSPSVPASMVPMTTTVMKSTSTPAGPMDIQEIITEDDIDDLNPDGSYKLPGDDATNYVSEIVTAKRVLADANSTPSAAALNLMGSLDRERQAIERYKGDIDYGDGGSDYFTPEQRASYEDENAGLLAGLGAGAITIATDGLAAPIIADGAALAASGWGSALASSTIAAMSWLFKNPFISIPTALGITGWWNKDRIATMPPSLLNDKKDELKDSAFLFTLQAAWDRVSRLFAPNRTAPIPPMLIRERMVTQKLTLAELNDPQSLSLTGRPVPNMDEIMFMVIDKSLEDVETAIKYRKALTASMTGLDRIKALATMITPLYSKAGGVTRLDESREVPSQTLAKQVFDVIAQTDSISFAAYFLHLAQQFMSLGINMDAGRLAQLETMAALITSRGKVREMLEIAGTDPKNPLFNQEIAISQTPNSLADPELPQPSTAALSENEIMGQLMAFLRSDKFSNILKVGGGAAAAATLMALVSTLRKTKMKDLGADDDYDSSSDGVNKNSLNGGYFLVSYSK